MEGEWRDYPDNSAIPHSKEAKLLINRIKDPKLSELDSKIAGKLADWRRFMKLAETDPIYLRNAEAAYGDMDSLLDLRNRYAATKQMA